MPPVGRCVLPVEVSINELIKISYRLVFHYSLSITKSHSTGYDEGRPHSGGCHRRQRGGALGWTFQRHGHVSGLEQVVMGEQGRALPVLHPRVGHGGKYINFSPDYKNPADTVSKQGAKFTLDSTAFWNGLNMRRIELISQTKAAIVMLLRIRYTYIVVQRLANSVFSQLPWCCCSAVDAPQPGECEEMDSIHIECCL
ncbi:hypothetical protein GGR54DRAFT_642198 [Hypoxylon sp. NC1633]|nr:hypothetical protein GGR54DRAFT_642198 [Hypoxylon sp. NC1633]